MTPEAEIKALSDITVIEIRDIAKSLTGQPADKNPAVMAALQTVAKNLVGAINEIFAAVNAVDVTTVVDDANAGTTTTYSSDKILQEISGQIATALEGEDLSDLAGQITALMQADQGLLNFGSVQTLTVAQQVQGQANLGLGDLTNLDLVNRFNTARNA